MTRTNYFIAAAVAGVFLFFNSVFIVKQTEQALILQLGEYVRTIKDPGLSFKIPFIQSIVKIDRRLLSYDLPPTQNHLRRSEVFGC